MLIMITLCQMKDLVKDNVLQADWLFLRQFQINPNAPFDDIAGTPARLHAFGPPFPRVKSRALLDFGRHFSRISS